MPRRSLGTMGVLLGVAFLAGIRPAPAQQNAPRQPVNLKVLLPAADAKLQIDGTMTRQTGAERRFITPPLEPGTNYSYTLTATWEPESSTRITRTRKVTFQAGQQVEIDLRQADDKNPDEIVLRKAPTPAEAVEVMCKLAEVGKDDVVYDLSCGDGRIVLAAVQKFGAKRGVGVDSDPGRIQEAQLRAREAGVDDKVEFRQGDVLRIEDLAEATVVLLDLSEELNRRLRPILQKKLKPGTRVVSYRFPLGDWKPLRTQTVKEAKGQMNPIHLWKVGEGAGDK